MTSKKKRSIFDLIDEHFDDFEEWAERFREVLSERPSWNQKMCTIEPLREITVAPTEVIVTMDLPFVKESAIQIKPLENNTIQVSAKMKRKLCFNDFGITHYRGEFQTFHCQTRIPVPVGMDKKRIRFKKGILEIRLPRKREYNIAAK